MGISRGQKCRVSEKPSHALPITSLKIAIMVTEEARRAPICWSEMEVLYFSITRRLGYDMHVGAGDDDFVPLN